jgi:2-oxo-4-hydroxy-4-carboxy-5-ureidoimidazoline decarboxylase
VVSSVDPSPLHRLNALPRLAARHELLACCASRTWANVVEAGRPYPDADALAAAGDAAVAELSWADVVEALAAHPRIGERARGGGRDAAWSRREQTGVVGADEVTLAALAEANRQYERCFDHVFLIFASGRTPAQMLAEARTRLRHDVETERVVVREELRKITRRRLERLVAS